MIRAGILGPTGYAGLQLIDILLRHPEVELTWLASRREERPRISEIWPSLLGRIDMACSLLDADPIPALDVAFVALPHTIAMRYVPQLLDKDIKVVDISADYRLKDPKTYARWYQVEHTDTANLKRSVYGLPEFFGESIADADLVANPGCHPTAVALALAPLLSESLAREDGQIIVDAKSGVTGAGRNPKPHLHFPEANENMAAYKVGTHQHTGEILQIANRLAGRDVDVLFTPHIVPMDRGILATCYVPLASPMDTDALCDLYARTYAAAPFVRVMPANRLPTTKQVTNTNFCDIAVRGVGSTAVAIACIDNLVKGASGQAVQNMNIMFGLEETTGLV